MQDQRKPVVYLFYGDDVVAINEAIADLKSRVGDPSAAELNYLVLDGRADSVEQLETAGRSLPFLTDRRLTILHHPLAMMRSGEKRERFLSLLENLPDKSAVVLAVEGLPQTKEDKRNYLALKKWAASMGEKVYRREFGIPQLTGWIMGRAQKMGGEFEPQAANRLSEMVGEDVRMAEKEVTKLLTYVNFDRPVAETDVLELTVLQPEGFIFDFVDALGERNREKAVNEFHRLLADSEIQNIFGMIVRQFRLLVQSREIVDQGGGEQEITRTLGVHPFVGKKLAHQAHQFSQPQLDAIFHRLLEIDSGLKTGKMSVDLSIDILIADIT